MIKEIKIGNFHIGSEHPPFVIAEMSGNHNQSLGRALMLVEEAAKAGAHALKLQTYTADTMTLKLDSGEFFIKDEGNLWKGETLHNLYEKAHTPWEWHKPIFEKAKSLGMVALSSAFDESSVDFLESLDVPCYKIASFENIDIPLIKKVAATGKPIIMSTGMASLAELEDAVKAATESGCSELILLKCTSTYPASAENTNISTIPHMRDLFDCQVGLSDHTMGIGVSVGAVALGATVIEKHFTLRRKDGGVDSTFSMEPEEFQQLVHETKQAWLADGNVSYGPTDKELKSLKFRRSIYISEDIKAGDILTTENLRTIRPGLGLAPKYYDQLLGKKVNKDLDKGTAMAWGYIELPPA